MPIGGPGIERREDFALYIVLLFLAPTAGCPVISKGKSHASGGSGKAISAFGQATVGVGVVVDIVESVEGGLGIGLLTGNQVQKRRFAGKPGTGIVPVVVSEIFVVDAPVVLVDSIFYGLECSLVVGACDSYGGSGFAKFG